MIKQFNDLSANERTYLAWLRTSLALIAFGFMLERFDLFLKMFEKTVGEGKVPVTGSVGREAGIGMVSMGLLVILLSTGRFMNTTKRIRSEADQPYDTGGVLVMGGVFFILALLILFYVSKIITTA